MNVVMFVVGAVIFSIYCFGMFWNIRLLGFGVGTVTFGILTWTLMNEIPSLKTFICLLLALCIVLIQITNVIK